GQTTGYLYDGSNVVQELTGGTPTANMLTGGVDRVFVRDDVSGTKALLHGGAGSTLALTDTSGALVTQYTYDPFGGTTSGGTVSGNPTQYAGREKDATGLYY